MRAHLFATSRKVERECRTILVLAPRVRLQMAVHGDGAGKDAPINQMHNIMVP